MPRPPRPCKYCGVAGTHFEFACFKRPKKTERRVSYKAGKIIETRRKPINQKGKHFKLWMAAREKWFEQNKAEYYWCHYCSKQMTRSQLTLDHMQSRSRHPELRYVLSNLVPCCAADNYAKGSRSHDEYCTQCEIVH